MNMTLLNPVRANMKSSKGLPGQYLSMSAPGLQAPRELAALEDLMGRGF